MKTSVSFLTFDLTCFCFVMFCRNYARHKRDKTKHTEDVADRYYAWLAT